MPEGSAARKFLPQVDWQSRWPRVATWPGLRPEPTAAWRILCQAWPAGSTSIPYKDAYLALGLAGVSHSAACRRIQSLVRAGLARKIPRPTADPFAAPVPWLELVDPDEVEQPPPRWHRPKARVRPGRAQGVLFEASETPILRLHHEEDDDRPVATPEETSAHGVRTGPGSALCANRGQAAAAGRGPGRREVRAGVPGGGNSIPDPATQGASGRRGRMAIKKRNAQLVNPSTIKDQRIKRE